MAAARPALGDANAPTPSPTALLGDAAVRPPVMRLRSLAPPQAVAIPPLA